MDPLTLLIIGGAAGLGKVGTGIWQRAQANKLARQNNLDTIQVPKEMQQNLAQANRMATEGLPEASYQAQKNAINQNIATGIRTLSQRRNTAGGVNTLVANANRGTQQLNAMDAQARQQNQKGVMTARDIVARYKDQRYRENQAAIAAMRGAGIQNIAGGFDSIGSTAVNSMMIDKQPKP